MPPQSSSLTPVQFLSAGNLITAGLHLYRKHFKDYFRLSLIGGAWLFLPLVGLVLLVGSLFVITSSGAGSGTGVENPATLLLIALLIFVGAGVYFLLCLAKYQAFAAAISRLAFHELIRAPQTPKDASRYTNARLWGFWLINFLLFLLFVAIGVGLYILLAIAIVVLAFGVTGIAFLQGSSTPDNPAAIASILTGLGFLVLVAGVPLLSFVLWLVSRFFISEVPYAIEPDITPAHSIVRGWILTHKSAWRLALMIMVGGIVMLPLQFIQQIVGTLLQALAAIVDPNQASALFIVAIVVSYALSLFLSMLILPFWQATKAVIYYDLRSRREGMGLELANSQGHSLQDEPLQRPPVMQLFNQVKLMTPESVELEFMLAGIGNRALALLIDYGIIVLGWLLFWGIWGVFSYQLLNYLEQLGGNYRSAPLWLLAIAILITFVFTTGYFVGFEVLRQGQTPGKRYAKIRVIRDDGRPVGLTQAVLRSLLQLIDYFFFIGAFMIFLGKREKRVGDWAAGTLVIQDNRANRQTITLSNEARLLATDLPKTTDLTQLHPYHFAVVSEYLQRRSFMTATAKSNLSLDLARQLRSLIHLETIPQGLTSDQFLEAIYLAYQQQFPAY